MKKVKTLLLLSAFGLFAASCGESTTEETTMEDTMTTSMPDNTGGMGAGSAMTADTMGAGTMNNTGSATGGMVDTTATDTIAR